MPGLLIFPTLAAALREGYQVCGSTERGYLVRVMTARGWATALVELRHG